MTISSGYDVYFRQGNKETSEINPTPRNILSLTKTPLQCT
jgi:hypothetical protein